MLCHLSRHHCERRSYIWKSMIFYNLRPLNQKKTGIMTLAGWLANPRITKPKNMFGQKLRGERRFWSGNLWTEHWRQSFLGRRCRHRRCRHGRRHASAKRRWCVTRRRSTTPTRRRGTSTIKLFFCCKRWRCCRKKSELLVLSIVAAMIMAFPRRIDAVLCTYSSATQNCDKKQLM